MAAQDELMLLERVFLRIGSAETDDQLQNAVSKFLPPVLLKLSSQQEGVRKKVMELLIHINKRIKSRPKIQLPVEALLLQYQDPSATSFVTNFTIIYIKMGFPRLEPSKQAELAPCLLNSLEGKPQSHQDSLLLMMMPVLSHIVVPADPVKRKTLFGLSEKPRIAKLLLDFMLDMLLLPYGVSSQLVSKSADDIGPSSGASTSVSSGTPPGLSDYSFKRVTGENALSPEELEQAKLGIVKFISSGVIPEEDGVTHLIIGSSDTRHSVANAADMELKRISGGLDLNNSMTISKLYSIFLGTVLVKDQTVVKPEHKTVAASTRIRLKIFAHLLKSREAAMQFPACIQVIFDCLYGTNTNPKLKHMAVQFVHHISHNCTEVRLIPIGPVLLSGMVKLIAESKDDAKLRSLAYVAVGKLAHKLPQLVTRDMALVQTFFDAVSQEDPNTRLAVQESLSLMLPAFKNLDEANLQVMEALLLNTVEKVESQVRLLAVEYASVIFPSNHIPSRYLLLLAAGDIKEDVRANAIKVLRSSATRKSSDMVLPSFPDVIAYFTEKASERLKSNQKYVIGNHTLAFNPATSAEMLVYLRACLVQSAGATWSPESTQKQIPAVAKYVRNLLKTAPGEKGPILLYVQLIRQVLQAIGGAYALFCLLEVVVGVPDVMAAQFTKLLDWIKNLMYSSKDEVRIYASELYAVVVVHSLDDAKLCNTIKELTSSLKDRSLEVQHGASLALGYAIGRKLRLTEHAKQNPALNSAFADATSALAGQLTETHALVLTSACIALGEIGRNGMLPLVEPSSSSGSFKTITDELLKLVTSSKTNDKVREDAALAAGYMCMSVQGAEHSKEVMDSLLECASEMKEVEIQCTVGESLVCAVLGPSCPSARDAWIVTEEEFTPSFLEEPPHLAWLLDEILTKYSSHTHPNTRQAACIWLMTLLKTCHLYPVMRERLNRLQQIFINFLTEGNDLVQDMASKGLSLIYEYSPPDQRGNLVAVLVETLMTGRRVMQVTDDTKIFEEGVIQTPLGGNLSTYKELCSFATDLNQPDLVYKFMNLARHDAVWNSKKGAAFGFSSIAAQAGEQLEPFMSQIVPRLYRYQYDPNSRIQQSMASIWHALVPEPTKTVDKYLKEILQDLKTNLTNNLWRVRESCCLALADLLRGRQLEEVIDDLPELWEICFRVRDDIKESVRLAAESALKSLSKVSVKLCDASSTKTSSRTIELLLPVLLRSGLCSPVAEVRAVSLPTLMKIAKQAGPLLKPQLPLLLVSLLESLSAMESSQINQLSVQLGSHEATQERLDTARIAASKASPMMDTVNFCVQYVDNSVLEELVPRLIELIRSGVGIGTKAGCANFVISLTHQCPRELQAYAGKLLAAFVAGLNDRNPAVRKSYASVIGHLVKTAKDSSVEKLIAKLQKWYMQTEEDSVRCACAYTLLAVARHSPDVLKQHSAQALPLAFLAMHSPKSKENGTSVDMSQTVWEDIWLEGTPGTEGGIRLFLSEIVEVTQQALELQSWTMKAQAALAMSTIATKLGSNLGPPHLGNLLKALLKGLSGRTWTGKETLLKAIQSICVNSKTALSNTSEHNQPSLSEIIDIVLKECRKENLLYKQTALLCLATILETHEEDRFAAVLEIALPVLTKDRSRRDDADDVSFDTKEKDQFQSLQETTYEVLGLSWPKNQDTQQIYQEQVCDVLSSAVVKNIWKVQLIIMKSLGKYIERLYLFDAVNLSPEEQQVLQRLAAKLVPPLRQCIGATKYGTLRTEALNTIEILIVKLKANDRIGLLPEDVWKDLQLALNAAVQDSKPDLQAKASELFKVIAAE